jgi:hypothetical protein
MDYTETFRISRQIRTFKRIFPYITLKWSDREKFSVYHAQKRVSQISVLQTALTIVVFQG